jgi:hypothetical protein
MLHCVAHLPQTIVKHDMSAEMASVSSDHIASTTINSTSSSGPKRRGMRWPSWNACTINLTLPQLDRRIQTTLCAPCFLMQTSDSSTSGVALGPWFALPHARCAAASLPPSMVSEFFLLQGARLARTAAYMISIVQGANSVLQNPLNFGTSAGVQIVGVKVCLLISHLLLYDR